MVGDSGWIGASLDFVHYNKGVATTTKRQGNEQGMDGRRQGRREEREWRDNRVILGGWYQYCWRAIHLASTFTTKTIGIILGG